MVPAVPIILVVAARVGALFRAAWRGVHVAPTIHPSVLSYEWALLSFMSDSTCGIGRPIADWNVSKYSRIAVSEVVLA